MEACLEVGISIDCGVNQDQQSCDIVSSVKLSLITCPPVGLGHSKGLRQHIYGKMKLKDVA